MQVRVLILCFDDVNLWSLHVVVIVEEGYLMCRWPVAGAPDLGRRIEKIYHTIFTIVRTPNDQHELSHTSEQGNARFQSLVLPTAEFPSTWVSGESRKTETLNSIISRRGR